MRMGAGGQGGEVAELCRWEMSTAGLLLVIGPGDSWMTLLWQGDARHWSLCLGTLSGACAGTDASIGRRRVPNTRPTWQSWKAGLGHPGQCGLSKREMAREST